MGSGQQGLRPALVEGMDGVAHRLGAAPEIFGYARRTLSAGAGQKDLAAPEEEGIGGAQPCLQSLALLLRKRTNEDRRFHERNCNSSPTTCPADALGGVVPIRPNADFRVAIVRRRPREPSRSVRDPPRFGPLAVPLRRQRRHSVCGSRRLRPPRRRIHPGHQGAMSNGFANHTPRRLP